MTDPTAGEGEVPDWQVGDEWAVGVSKDLSADFDAALAEMKANLSAEPDVDSVDYTTNGKAGYFASYEVVDSGDPDLVKIVGSRGVYFHMAVTLTVMGQHYLPGNYSDVEQSEDNTTEEDSYNLTKAPLTMKIMGGADLVLKVDTVALFTKDTKELTDLTTEVTLGVEAQLGVFNVPDVRTGDWQNDTSTYQWVDIQQRTGKLEAKAELHLLVETAFEPALDVFNFPIEANEVWNDTADVTAKVSFWGDIDIKKPVGANPDDIQEFLDNVDKGLAENNWTKRVLKWSDLFPLHIPAAWMKLEEQLPEDAELTIENDRFVIGPMDQDNVNFTFHSGEGRTFTLPGGGETVGFPVLPGEPEEMEGRGSDGSSEENSGFFDGLPIESFVNNEGRMVGAIVELEEAPGGGLNLESVPVEPDEAQTALEDNLDTTNPRAGGVNAKGYVTGEEVEGPIDDIAPTNPLPAPGLLPVVAVVAGLALLLGRRLRV